jgi:hypothetical protein
LFYFIRYNAEELLVINSNPDFALDQFTSQNFKVLSKLPGALKGKRTSESPGKILEQL